MARVNAKKATPNEILIFSVIGVIVTCYKLHSFKRSFFKPKVTIQVEDKLKEKMIISNHYNLTQCCSLKKKLAVKIF